MLLLAEVTQDDSPGDQCLWLTSVQQGYRFDWLYLLSCDVRQLCAWQGALKDMAAEVQKGKALASSMDAPLQPVASSPPTAADVLGIPEPLVPPIQMPGTAGRVQGEWECKAATVASTVDTTHDSDSSLDESHTLEADCEQAMSRMQAKVWGSSGT